MLAPQKESIFSRSCRLWLLSWRRARVFARSCSLLSKYLPILWKQRKGNHMLSATSHIGLEFLTKFLNMSKLQNRLILLYQSLPLHMVSLTFAFVLLKFFFNFSFYNKKLNLAPGKKKLLPVLRLHGILSMAMDGPWQFHPWPGLVHGWTRDGNRHFYPWPGMDHPWPGLETKSPHAAMP